MISNLESHSSEWVPSLINSVGIGLRMQHMEEVLLQRPAVPWFEILADNHIAQGGIIPRQLDLIRCNYPITLHSVGMSIAGSDPLDFNYLNSLRQLYQDFEVAWISDHLCFSQHHQHQFHDLLPFPYTEESLHHVAQRVEQIQDYFAAPILIENVSSYLTFNQSSLSEAEFMVQLCDKTGCKVLLDVNNIYVNAFNNGAPSDEWLTTFNKQSIGEVHLAGYEDKGEYLLDAHNNLISDEVWKLYQSVVETYGNIPTLIEWDNDIPEFTTLQSEANKAEVIRSKYCSEAKSYAAI